MLYFSLCSSTFTYLCYRSNECVISVYEHSGGQILRSFTICISMGTVRITLQVELTCIWLPLQSCCFLCLGINTAAISVTSYPWTSSNAGTTEMNKRLLSWNFLQTFYILFLLWEQTEICWAFFFLWFDHKLFLFMIGERRSWSLRAWHWCPVKTRSFQQQAF